MLIIALPLSAQGKKKNKDSFLEKHDIGIGIILGEPTGFSMRFLERNVIGIAWSVENNFHLHYDFWVYRGTLKKPVNWYIGPGIKFFYKLDKQNEPKDYYGLTVRFCIGLQYYPIKELEIFMELVPGIGILPSTAFDIDGGIGVRYFF